MAFSAQNLLVILAFACLANGQSLYDPDNLWEAYEKCGKSAMLTNLGGLCDPHSRLDARGLSDVRAELAKFRDVSCVCAKASDCTKSGVVAATFILDHLPSTVNFTARRVFYDVPLESGSGCSNGLMVVYGQNDRDIYTFRGQSTQQRLSHDEAIGYMGHAVDRIRANPAQEDPALAELLANYRRELNGDAPVVVPPVIVVTMPPVVLPPVVIPVVTLPAIVVPPVVLPPVTLPPVILPTLPTLTLPTLPPLTLPSITLPSVSLPSLWDRFSWVAIVGLAIGSFLLALAAALLMALCCAFCCCKTKKKRRGLGPVVGPNIHGPNIHGPKINGPEIHGPRVHGPDFRGPHIGGPDFRGPSVAGSEVRGPYVRGPDVNVAPRGAIVESNDPRYTVNEPSTTHSTIRTRPGGYQPLEEQSPDKDKFFINRTVEYKPGTHRDDHLPEGPSHGPRQPAGVGIQRPDFYRGDDRLPEGPSGPSQAYLPGSRQPAGRETQRQDFYIDDKPVDGVSGRIVGAGESVGDKASNVLSSAKHGFQDAGHAVGNKLEQAGDAIMDKVPSTKIF